MQNVINSDIILLILAIGLASFWILVVVFCLYIIAIVRKFFKLIQKLEKNADKIGFVAQDLVEDVKNSTVFKFIFGKSKVRKSKTTDSE